MILSIGQMNVEPSVEHGNAMSTMNTAEPERKHDKTVVERNMGHKELVTRSAQRGRQTTSTVPEHARPRRLQTSSDGRVVVAKTANAVVASIAQLADRTARLHVVTDVTDLKV